MQDALQGIVQVGSVARVTELILKDGEWSPIHSVNLKEASVAVKNLPLDQDICQPWFKGPMKAIVVTLQEARRPGTNEESIKPCLQVVELLSRFPKDWPRVLPDTVMEKEQLEYQKIIGAVVKTRESAASLLACRRNADTQEHEVRIALTGFHKAVKIVGQWEGGPTIFSDSGPFGKVQGQIYQSLKILLRGDGGTNKGLVYLYQGLVAEHIQTSAQALDENEQELAKDAGCHKDGKGKLWWESLKDRVDVSDDELQSVFEVHHEVDTVGIEGLAEEVQEAGPYILKALTH